MTAGVTIVIPARSAPEPVLRLLAVLDGQAAAAGCVLPTIVVDDRSEPPLEPELGSVELRHLELTVARSDRSLGPGGARNLGLARVSTPWVAFLDADMLPGPGWLSRLREQAASPEAPDGLEGPVDAPGGAAATPFTHATEFSAPGTHHGAGNVAYRTDVLRGVGGFDERYYDATRGLHFREDTDLRFRLDEAGFRIEHDGELVALHPPLAASFWTPVRLARRYEFDALLAREHPDRFRALVRSRSLGPFSLRAARHLAATTFVSAATVSAGSLAAGRRKLAAGSLAIAAAAWCANVVALAWRRRVRAVDAPKLGLVALLVPFVYLWSFYRGVIRFRHRPRF